MNRKCPLGTRFFSFQPTTQTLSPQTTHPLNHRWSRTLKTYCEQVNHQNFQVWNNQCQYAARLFQTTLWLLSNSWSTCVVLWCHSWSNLEGPPACKNLLQQSPDFLWWGPGYSIHSWSLDQLNTNWKYQYCQLKVLVLQNLNEIRKGCCVCAVCRAGKNLVFLEKVFSFFLRFFRFQCTNMTGHKISTQEEHPIYNHSLSEHFL